MTHKLPKVKPVIVLTFKEPRAGFWNGGIKNGGTFHPRPNSDGTVEWGSFELNYWFRVKFGLTWKHAASFARKVIAKKCRVSCNTEVVWQ